ncbi:TetR/AcrR family transcriptional regulator [Micromonospora sp. GCM10011542]|uniref:TetR/AcrR family transcriptional regulator n=1 Tax=Micromonospora sp. GCM10011542 TaxID=3317337 RepID=UPI00361658DF
MADGPGLRERKKLATRRTLCEAALNLALTRGAEGLSPEGIAEAAEVSPRTFRNYFSSPEEAVIAGIQEQVTRVAEGLRGRPSGEPIWDSLRIVLVEELGNNGCPEDLMQLVGLVHRHHALLAEHLTVFEGLGRRLTEVIAERTGTDPNTDIYPQLMAHVAGMAVKTSLDLWSRGCTGRTLPELVGEVLDLLSQGVPMPAAPAEAVARHSSA